MNVPAPNTKAALLAKTVEHIDVASFDARPVIDAGGLFEYARRTGMIPATAHPDTREAVPLNRVVED